MNMFDNKILRYAIFGLSSIILSELALHTALPFYYWLRRRRRQINEVIWINELTQICIHKHGSFAAKVLPYGKMNGKSPVNRISKSNENSDALIIKPCENLFCPERCKGRIIELIDSAQYTMDIAMYTFTSCELSSAIKRAQLRGVVVRIISDREMAYSSGSEIINLTKLGVPVRLPNSTMLFHHKFCILDSPLRVKSILEKKKQKYNPDFVRDIVISGSLNWTMQGFAGNWENVVITTNRKIVEKFEIEYERMWKAFSIT